MVGIAWFASIGWRVISKNFHGNHNCRPFSKKTRVGHQFPSIKERLILVRHATRRRIYCWCACSLVSVLVPYSWMRPARDKNGIREMYRGREGEEKDRYLRPFFFSYAFLSLASLAHIVNLLWQGHGAIHWNKVCSGFLF